MATIEVEGEVDDSIRGLISDLEDIVLDINDDAQLNFERVRFKCVHSSLCSYLRI